MSEYPVRDDSWWGRTRDKIAYHIALFAFDVVATKWYSAMIEGSIRLGLDAAYAQIHNQDATRKYSVAEVKQIVYPLINALESDIVNIKELAPEYLNKRVEEYRRRTWKAENLLSDIKRLLVDYSKSTDPNKVLILTVIEIALMLRDVE